MGRTGPDPEPIDSPANDRLKLVRRLRRARDRRREGLFVAEGFRELDRLVTGYLVTGYLVTDQRATGGPAVVELLVSPALWTGRHERTLVDRIGASGAHVNQLTPRAFASISTQDKPDGLLAVAAIPPTGLDVQPPIRPDSLFCVVEGVERPGNLGTIARTALGAGVSGLILCGPQVDPFHPEVVRGSVGTLFSLPLSVTGVAELSAWARAGGVRLVVTTPDAPTLYSDLDPIGPTAYVLGSEKTGATPAMLAGAHARVRIPMGPGIDSLNVGVATGIVLFDAVRARSSTGATATAGPARPDSAARPVR